MIQIKQYDGVVFENLEVIFKITNVNYYKYVTSMGLEMNLQSKDQQKIYLHHFIINLCKVLQSHTNKVVFHINTFNICELHSKIIKKVVKIFGIRIWQSPYDLPELIVKLSNRDVEIVDKFDMWLEIDTKPKSFKHIKKYLDKEGFTQLSDTYFQDLSHKMSILC